MTNCTNCNGEGLVGQGDKPWLKQGHIETCGKCKGSGKIGEEDVNTQAETAASDVESTPAEDTSVDNASLSDGSQDASNGGDQVTPELG